MNIKRVKLINIISREVIEESVAVRDLKDVKQFLDPNGFYQGFEVKAESIAKWELVSAELTCEIKLVAETSHQFMEDEVEDTPPIRAVILVGDGVIYASTCSYNDILASVTEDSGLNVIEAEKFGYQDEVLRVKYLSSAVDPSNDNNGLPILFTKTRQ